MSAAARRLVLATAACIGVGSGVAAWMLRSAPPAPPLEIGGYLLEPPRVLPPVTLIDEHAAAFVPADFAGGWSMLYFGYTYCPDVCPLTLVELAKLKQLLATQAPAVSVDYYLVSVDPARDTPERLREYVTYFDLTFRGLTGSPEALTQLATAASSLFVVPKDQGTEHYLVSHSSNVVLLNPDGALQAVFTPPHDPQRLAADFAAVRSRYEAGR